MLPASAQDFIGAGDPDHAAERGAVDRGVRCRLEDQGDTSERKLASERDVEMWSIALIGPAAMILIVTVLGLTITFRSLRKDFRHQHTLDRYWRHGAMSRANRGSRG